MSSSQEPFNEPDLDALSVTAIRAALARVGLQTVLMTADEVRSLYLRLLDEGEFEITEPPEPEDRSSTD